MVTVKKEKPSEGKFHGHKFYCRITVSYPLSYPIKHPGLGRLELGHSQP